MESQRFDALARRVAAPAPRRVLLGLSLTLATGWSLPMTEAKKKKKKKCRAPKVKCGKKCLPPGSCCSNADCGTGGVCSNQQCQCLSGFKACGQSCLPDSACCADADCSAPCSRCQNNVCIACAAGQTCLANGSCGLTCESDGECVVSSGGFCLYCARDEGGDPVCRETTFLDPNFCDEAQRCTTTANCDPGFVCVPQYCGPFGPVCMALCLG